MNDFQIYKTKQMKDPEFRAEYDRSRPEYEIMHELVKARVASNITQKELSEKSGIRQSNISRIESGSCSPTVATLQALAKGLGKKLTIRFE